MTKITHRMHTTHYVVYIGSYPHCSDWAHCCWLQITRKYVHYIALTFFVGTCMLFDEPVAKLCFICIAIVTAFSSGWELRRNTMNQSEGGTLYPKLLHPWFAGFFLFIRHQNCLLFQSPLYNVWFTHGRLYNQILQPSTKSGWFCRPILSPNWALLL